MSANKVSANKTKERSRGLSFALFLALLIAGFLIGSRANAAEGCSPVRLNTFSVEIGATRRVVTVGGIATIQVEVQRSAAGETLVPAEHAEILAVVTVGGVSTWVAGETDHDGVAKLRVQLPDKVRPGLADVAATAKSRPAYCVEEYGEAEVKGLFKVVR